MASVNSPIRSMIKPLLYKLLGNSLYKHFQCYGKLRDIKYKLVEEKEMVLLPKLVKQGDEVLDLGANYAYFSERLSKLVGETGKVYAFEPIPFTHEVCKMIIKKLKVNNVELFKVAASNTNEELTFRVPKLDFGAISAGQSHLAERNNEMDGKENYYAFNNEELVTCQGQILDEIILPKAKKLSFVKIDIEGGEYFALHGLKKTIEKFKPTILIEIQPFFLEGLNIKESQMLNLIEIELGYSIYYFDETIKLLKLLKTKFWDSNFVLIHKSNIKNYKHLISEQV